MLPQTAFEMAATKIPEKIKSVEFVPRSQISQATGESTTSFWRWGKERRDAIKTTEFTDAKPDLVNIL
jgi:hypothetical protein